MQGLRIWPVCAAVALASAGDARADASADAADVPVRALGTVTVVGSRPTSLPAQLPTTIESIERAQIEERINATDSEDVLKYFPSLIVRKRYIGDFDHAVLGSRASGTNNSARSLVYADGILLSNLLGNSQTFTPRWGLVTPEEIERVDVLYGPFSAAYSGNSAGAVVDYVTRMPEHFEAHARMSSFGEDFKVYGTDERYTGWQASASAGSRVGRWSWWLNFNRLDSDGHPMQFANKLVSSASGTGGTPVSGALAGRDPRNREWVVVGSTNAISTVQDHAKAKLAYDISPAVRASYTLGVWKNDASRTSETYLRDADGDPVYSGPVQIDGRGYVLAATDIAPSLNELVHIAHGLSIKSDTRGQWDWELAGSLYDYNKDLSRSPTVALPAAASGGAGRTADMEGTGWNTATVKAVWRPQGVDGAHLIDLGVERDAFRLRTRVSSTNNWISGGADTPFSSFRGETRLQSVYVQDTWRFAPAWRTTLGLRGEEWRAFDGAISTGAAAPLPFVERKETYLSPKAALAYQMAEQWTLKASLGKAVRTPTVSELYQGSITADSIVNNDPALRPEISWTSELTAERLLSSGLLRTTVFHETTRDALYSQVNTAVGGTVTTIQNIDRIRTSGAELSYQADDAGLEGLDLSSSLTYARSRIVRNDNFLASVGKWQPRVPEWRGNLVAAYRWNERWTTTLGARYSGRQYSTLDNVDPNGTAYTGTSNFFVVDARVRYRIMPQCTASLTVDNLNNDRYWAFHPYSQRTVAAELNFDF